MQRKNDAASSRLRHSSKRTEAGAPAPFADGPMAEKHFRVWRALDRVAESQGLSPSSLAKLAGLDATAFNPSKRIARDGRLRWPGVETLTKVSQATGVSLVRILGMIDDTPHEVRYLPLAQLVAGDCPNACRLEEGDTLQAAFAVDDDDAFYLDLNHDAPPHYRKGDRLIVSPAAERGDGAKVVAASSRGEAWIGCLAGEDDTTIEIAAFAGDSKTRVARADCLWIGRILWASQ